MISTTFDGVSDSALLSEFCGRTQADALLARFGTLTHLFNAEEHALADAGATPSVVRKVKVCQALHVRRCRETVNRRTVITAWHQLLEYVKVTMAGDTRESFRVLFLDKKNQLIADEVQQRGTVGNCPVYPREVIRRAVILEASHIILVHNHPSGDPTPSLPDIDMTRQIIEAGRALGITVHDHLVVGIAGVASMKDLRLI